MIDLKTIVSRNNALPSTAVDNDIVILNLATNNYVGLDDIGRAIWEMIERSQPVVEICTQMIGRYDGPPEQIRADVLAFLESLRREGLVHVAQG